MPLSKRPSNSCVQMVSWCSDRDNGRTGAGGHTQCGRGAGTSSSRRASHRHARRGRPNERAQIKQHPPQEFLVPGRGIALVFERFGDVLEDVLTRQILVLERVDHHLVPPSTKVDQETRRSVKGSYAGTPKPRK